MLRIRKFGENQSGYNAALLELLFLFCAASPELVFAKVMPRLERVSAVSVLEDHASDTALAKAIVAEVDDKAERHVDPKAKDNQPTKAYSYEINNIEVMAGTAEPQSSPTPQTSMDTGILLNGVCDVNGVLLLSEEFGARREEGRAGREEGRARREEGRAGSEERRGKQGRD